MEHFQGPGFAPAAQAVVGEPGERAPVQHEGRREQHQPIDRACASTLGSRGDVPRDERAEAGSNQHPGPGGMASIAVSTWPIMRDVVRVSKAGSLKSGAWSAMPSVASRSASSSALPACGEDTNPWR